MNTLPTPVRIATVLLAILVALLHAKFLNECTEAWQVAPTSLTLVSIIVFLVASAMNGSDRTILVVFSAAMMACIGIAWIMIASGNPSPFYPIWGGTAGTLMLLGLIGVNIAVMRRKPDNRPTILA